MNETSRRGDATAFVRSRGMVVVFRVLVPAGIFRWPAGTRTSNYRYPEKGTHQTKTSILDNFCANLSKFYLGTVGIVPVFLS